MFVRGLEQLGYRAGRVELCRLHSYPSDVKHGSWPSRETVQAQLESDLCSPLLCGLEGPVLLSAIETCFLSKILLIPF